MGLVKHDLFYADTDSTSIIRHFVKILLNYYEYYIDGLLKFRENTYLFTNRIFSNVFEEFSSSFFDVECKILEGTSHLEFFSKMLRFICLKICKLTIFLQNKPNLTFKIK